MWRRLRCRIVVALEESKGWQVRAIDTINVGADIKHRACDCAEPSRAHETQALKRGHLDRLLVAAAIARRLCHFAAAARYLKAHDLTLCWTLAVFAMPSLLERIRTDVKSVTWPCPRSRV